MQFIKFWKATEFRTTLLYFGIVAFKDILDEKVYVHFLQLCLAIRLFSCQTYVNNVSYKRVARKLLDDFCSNFIKIYGSNAVVSNIHNISHIFDDVYNFGPLSDISTYSFENKLRDFKLRIQPSNTPIHQITRRIAEFFVDQSDKPIDFIIQKI